MARKFKYRPRQASYAVQTSISEYARNQLKGGAGKFRRDVSGASRLVDCRWIFKKSGYDYACAFERVFSANPEPFLIDLIVNEAALIECKAWFMPDSFKLTEQRGNGYYVTAQLEVIPPLYDPAIDEALLVLMEEFGEDWRDYLDRLHVLVNVKLPEAMPKWLK